jgi:DNA-binding beta-propeller fold protein YncE
MVAGAPTEANCPSPGATTEGDGHLFVLCGAAWPILEVNATTDQVDGAIPFSVVNGSEIGGIAFDPVTNSVYIGTQNAVGLQFYSNLTGFNLSTGRWASPWAAAGIVGPLEYDPTDHLLYEGAEYSDGIVGYDASSGTAEVTVALQSSVWIGSTVIDPQTNQMYVGLTDSSEVDLLNLSIPLFGAAVPIPGMPGSLAFDPVDDRIFVAISNESNVTVLNASDHTVIGSFPTGAQPGGVAWDSATDELYVANAGSANVSVIWASNDSLDRTLAVGPDPTVVLADPTDALEYVQVSGKATLLAFHASTGATAAGTVLGAYPYALAFDPLLDALLVGDNDLNTVTAYAESNWAPSAEVQLNAAPFSLVVDPSGDRVFVADQLPSQISVLNVTTLALEATYPLPFQPFELAYWARGNLLAVGGIDSTNVTFLNASTGANVLQMPFDYAAGFAIDSAQGILYVTGTGGSLSDNQPYVAAVNLSTLALAKTAALTADPVLWSIAYDASDGLLYVGTESATEMIDPSDLSLVAPLSGTTGGDLLVDSANGALASMAYNGLEIFAPGGTTEVANVSIPCYSGGAIDPVHSLYFDPSIVNGTIAILTLGPVAPALTALPSPIPVGSATVLTTSVYLATPPLSYAYPSLPTGCAAANRAILNCTPSAAGNYSISVTVTDASGLEGSASTVLVVQEIPGARTYAVTFNETGLGLGASWTLTFDGTPYTTPNASVAFLEPNGTYPFSVRATGYTASPASGNVTVQGIGVAWTIALSALATHGFLAGGVSPGSARLTINGAVTPFSGSQFNVSLPPGRYVVAATANGYSSFSTTATVNVAQTTYVNISLIQNATNGTTMPAAATSTYVWVGLGVVVAVIVTAAAVYLLARRGRRSPPSSTDPSPATPPSAPAHEGEEETIYR